VIANMFKFREEQYFEVDEALRGDAGVPRVSFGAEAPGVSFGDGATESAPRPAEAAPAEEPPPTPERPDE
jgi:hypothetical protein